MKRLYIAGPMSGKPYLNVAAFDAATERLATAGYYVVSPIDLDRRAGCMPYNYQGGIVPEEVYHARFNASMQSLLSDCCAIALLDEVKRVNADDRGMSVSESGWITGSKGTRAEIAAGTLAGYPIYNVAEWLHLSVLLGQK